ncbi:hypothetical protein DPMN_018436 [Dreissena polymorpha]|uniref:Uncharacterized protein n=1 Tax=Dreissena polymorpha TaxID=45954 RepID=A0A9D4NID6_DREPO|nr:hypothetical protein DPMN_018436 [Dreissena polymorpha]
MVLNPLQINWHKRCSRGEGHKQHQWYNYMSLQRPLSRSLPAASRSLHPPRSGLGSSALAAFQVP